MRRRRLRLLAVALAGLAPFVGAGVGAAYDDDGHFYTTTVLQTDRRPPYSGARRDQAALLAYCAQLPDLAKEFDAVTLRVDVIPSFTGVLWGAFSTCRGPGVRHMATVHHYLHALTGEKDRNGQPLDSTRVTDAAVATLKRLYAAIDRPAPANPNDVCAAGFAIHLLGDSFAHRQRDNPARMYEPGLGHFRDSHDPDRILYTFANGTNRSGLWLEYVRVLGEALGIGLDRAQLDALNRSVTDNLKNATPREYGESQMRESLRKLINAAPPPAFDWMPYQPPLEDLTADDGWWGSHVLQWSCTGDSDAAHDLFRRYPPPGGPVSCPTVWATYKAAATAVFDARGLAAACRE